MLSDSAILLSIKKEEEYNSDYRIIVTDPAIQNSQIYGVQYANGTKNLEIYEKDQNNLPANMFNKFNNLNLPIGIYSKEWTIYNG